MSEETQEVQATEASGTEIGNGNVPESAPPVVEVTKPAEAPAAEAVTPEVPQYTPNYKFKVHDEEKEFDEFIRSSIKDQETEKKARELYEKAYGLDVQKPKYEELKKKYPELENNYKQLDTAVSEVLDLGEKDLGLFFERLKIPEERVAQWMLERIRKMELPPEQKAMYDNFEETKRRNLVLEKQFQELNGLTQSQAVQARTMELESGLQRPEVNSFSQAFDAARKTPGAFKQEVQECGLFEWKVNSKDISAADAIQRVMSRYQGMITPTAMGVAPDPTVEKPLPVIPRTQGKSVSSVGKQVRSIQDLKKRFEEVAG